MTGQQPLDDLRARLAGGATSAAVRNLGDGWVPDATAALLAPVRTVVDLVSGTAGGGLSSQAAHAAVTALTTYLETHRQALMIAVLAPFDVLDGVAATASPRDPTRHARDLWQSLCWIAEAAWRALDGDRPDGVFAAGDRALLRPLAARLRFLVLAEPMRWRHRDTVWTPTEADTDTFGAHGFCEETFGEASWITLVGRARHARATWRSYLDEYQSHPYLACAGRSELDDDLRWLVFTSPATSRSTWWRLPTRARFGRPLGLSGTPLNASAPLTAEDAALIADTTERHLLPRFALLPVARLAVHDEKTWRAAARLAVAWSVVVTGVGSVVGAATLHPFWATASAVGCYGLIGFGTVVFGVAWAAPWLLRIPAAGSIGLLALISFFPERWLTEPPTGYPAVAALGAVAVGYLAVEGRNHGLSAGAAFARSIGVAFVGAVHCSLVTLIGLVIVAPAFTEKGDQLARLWDAPMCDFGGRVLVLSAAWCLAAGILSQILWDDRPITAPLAHLSWPARG